VLQLCLTASKPFALELSISDETGSKRRLNISSGFSRVHATLMHAQVPLLGIEDRRGVWLTLCIGEAVSLHCNLLLRSSEHHTHSTHLLPCIGMRLSLNKELIATLASINALCYYSSDLVDIVKSCFKTVYRSLDLVKISPSLKLRKVKTTLLTHVCSALSKSMHRPLRALHDRSCSPA
jgi:hypothetical protein